jgi:hypothetical protein
LANDAPPGRLRGRTFFRFAFLVAFDRIH